MTPPALTGFLSELRSRSLLPGDLLALLIVGSVARGWANSRSDRDFYVITKTSWRRPDASSKVVPLQPVHLPREVLHVDGRRWELTYWLDRQVDQMLTKVSWERFESGDPVVAALVEEEESFLERLFTCVPLTGADWVRRRREQVNGSAFQAFLVTRSLARADGYVEDALGQLADGDLHSAVLSARTAFGHTVDALLESGGSFGSQVPKWRARRLKEAKLTALPFDRYWELETMAGFRADDPRPWIEEVITLCKRLSMEVEI
ncbi:hypothetical protein [Micromonospora cathayae]|uniref:Nucleotidyltransferase domain-containing protein n=1 Tax=Micromonospora cathayae TaxID=3028804 RepID=A0ABY7ZUZ1_9ACTN|nr:hypothetical protein [Micromonospora sp. HUAS 3]WDZ85853.1 hypothetical protein PVK37_05305 [Micromonospora sp. HUAS 3]